MNKVTHLILKNLEGDGSVDERPKIPLLAVRSRLFPVMWLKVLYSLSPKLALPYLGNSNSVNRTPTKSQNSLDDRGCKAVKPASVISLVLTKKLVIDIA